MGSWYMFENVGGRAKDAGAFGMHIIIAHS